MEDGVTFEDEENIIPMKFDNWLEKFIIAQGSTFWDWYRYS
ncbi:hypothetical protein [Heyndrickxia sp. FSL W8-0423]